MPVHRSDQLFVSFWDVCLDNLPEGGFVRRCISPEDAQNRVHQARVDGSLLCLSEADLLAPYTQRELGRHQALCAVLKEHFGIDLSLKDFCSADEDQGETLHVINALNLAQVRPSAPLLVISCAYRFARTDNAEQPPFEIAPDTLVFHLIEAVPGSSGL
jgi:hypothetical protein